MKALPELYVEVLEYCRRQGWVPVGWRSWDLGPWKITVNGTKAERDGVPPFHVLIERPEFLGLILIGPDGGNVVGLPPSAEDDVIRLVRASAEGRPVAAGG